MDLHLNVRGIYFDAYVAGAKKYEYRLYNEYWKKRLVGKNFNKIYYKCGYPKADDRSKIVELPYRGFEIQTITHPHFGKDPVKVFAIRLEGKT